MSKLWLILITNLEFLVQEKLQLMCQNVICILCNKILSGSSVFWDSTVLSLLSVMGNCSRLWLWMIKRSLSLTQNRGVYMFRIDDNLVVDATMAGGPARYINHSCNPNCVAEVVPFEKDSKIIIIAKRRISRGEEVFMVTLINVCKFVKVEHSNEISPCRIYM